MRNAKVNLQIDVKLVNMHRAVIRCIPLDNINFHFFGQEITCLLSFLQLRAVKHQRESRGALLN